MRVGYEAMPTSSFFSVEKDLNLIFKKLLKNQRLLKLLYYTQPDCLKASDLNGKQIESMIGKQLLIVPKKNIDLSTCPNFIYISLHSFSPNDTNPEFRDCILQFDICCHFDHWNLGNFELRPYKIAGEIDGMFEKKKLTGIGESIFAQANNWAYQSEAGGLSLKYWLIHGSDDQIQ